MNIDIIALQEPALNAFNLTVASRDWITIYPTTHREVPEKTRSIILIRSQISTDIWNQLDFPSSDVTAIQLNGTWGKLTLLNIYNDGNNNDTIQLLTKFHRENKGAPLTETKGSAHTLWIGDFNRHHPHWDDPSDTRLFTKEALKAAEILIDAVAEAGLDLALPSRTPTHFHNVTKRWSRLDQVFLSEHSENMLIACSTQTKHRGINTDHLPILTELDLEINTTEPPPIPNFREVDWADFGKTLEENLTELQPATQIVNQEQLERCCGELTNAIQKTIKAKVPVTKITSNSKRWWTRELTQLRKLTGKLGRQSYKRRNEPDHAVHSEYKVAAKRYEKELLYTKRQHWRDWLEKADDPDIWVAHKLVSSAATDGGKARIPILKHKVGENEIPASTNSEKSEALAKCFFPPRPQDSEDQNGNGPVRKQVANSKITKEQIRRQLRKLKPYKAPGPDGIPNIVLTKCSQLLTDRLHRIYEAMYERSLFYAPWKCFTTVVLRKPGKPRYDVPKAYRPIALLNTMWKVLTAIVAEQLTHDTEKYQLLPANHFGGRPGRTTTDAMHLLTHKIKASWRKGKVTSVLFLDIEGAFPNAVPSCLEQNMRRRGVAGKITNFIQRMLQDRKTTLKFDGYTSEPINIDNGIGQGDPLSMVMYQYYNADLLEIPKHNGEEAMAYVDDTLMLATAKTFTETHEMLADMMTRAGGVADWSTAHNSPLEYTKLALIDFAHRCKPVTRPPLRLPQGEVKPVENTKYLGVIFDQHLNWKAQHANAIGKGTKWISQIKRLTRTTWGITPSYAKRLYTSVAIPRILYAVDVWCNPTRKEFPDHKGTAKVIKQITSIQRAGALAITGGLRTSPTDALDASAFLLPAPATIDKWCHRATVRLAMLPPEHPLHKVIASKATRKTKRHKTPIGNLLTLYQLDPKKFKKIQASTRNPSKRGKLPFSIQIAEDRDKSIKEAQNIKEEVKVFADGSAINGKVGAAAVLIRAGNPPRKLHMHLGSENEHTVHEAELIGVLLALHLISTERRGNTTFALGIDNQAAIKAFESDLRQPGHHIAREIIRVANQNQKRRKKGKYALNIRWTAGHEGIEGNEEADKEAKKAAEGLSSEKLQLPPYLRKTLLINPAAVKRHLQERRKQKWTEEWRKSPRGQRSLRIDETTPSKKFLETISNHELSREAASHIAQLRLNHFPINHYLKRIGRVDKAQCPACGADNETIEHYLLTCPSYAHERWELEQHARKIKKRDDAQNTPRQTRNGDSSSMLHQSHATTKAKR
jgi:ribonuclease HI